jgi:2-desacetyl-2-hydroxyethyl bacteriochlorophyllide A dehydrogenase
MRALRLEEIGSIDVASVREPQAADGEVLVQVTVAGICGTDRHLISGEYPATPPVTLGHELEGVVTATGTGTTMAVGTRVAVDPNIACLNCRYCGMGLVAHCQKLHAVGVDKDGGLAEFVTVPQRQAYELPAGLPAGFGALCEPLACCVRAMDHAVVQPGDKVAVLGGGVIGQLLAQLARLAGARVVLVTRQRQRRDLAEALGAMATLDPAHADVGEAIAGFHGVAPGGVDIAFEAAGVADTFRWALEVVRPAGKVVVVGTAPSTLTLPVSPYDLFARELQVLGSHLNPLTHGRAVELAGSGLLDLGPLITRTVDLSQVKAVLSAPVTPGDVKVQVVPG